MLQLYNAGLTPRTFDSNGWTTLSANHLYFVRVNAYKDNPPPSSVLAETTGWVEFTTTS